MRKITETIANAFAQGNKMTVGNTATAHGEVLLHGNCIVDTDPWGNITMSLAKQFVVSSPRKNCFLITILAP